MLLSKLVHSAFRRFRNVCTVNDCPQVCDMLVQKYPTIFDSIGKLKNAEVALHIDMSIAPVAQVTCRNSFHILEKQGIIEKVNGQTPWVSPLVISPKKNCKVHMCRLGKSKQGN